MYIRGAGGEIVKTKDSANNSRYFSYNAHGDTTNIIEKNAESTSFAVTAAYEYDAFEGLVSGTGGEAESNVFRYNGQYTDEETGLIYLRNRYYDPSIGRFTQEDPIQSGTNWYVYCENDPINFIDILGLLREANPRRDQTENVEGTFVTKITAEKIKIEIGCAYKREEEKTMRVTGRNLITGLPYAIEVSSSEMLEALDECVEQIVVTAHVVLEKTPPELAADISDRGIIMTGGGSLLYGLDKRIEERTGIKVIVANEPLSCVAAGTGKALSSIDLLKSGGTFNKK